MENRSDEAKELIKKGLLSPDDNRNAIIIEELGQFDKDPAQDSTNEIQSLKATITAFCTG